MAIQETSDRRGPIAPPTVARPPQRSTSTPVTSPTVTNVPSDSWMRHAGRVISTVPNVPSDSWMRHAGRVISTVPTYNQVQQYSSTWDGAQAPAASGGGNAAPAPAPSGQGNDLSTDMLNAALKQIEAQYGLTEAQLLNDESDVGRRYRLVYAELQRQNQIGQSLLEAGALDRGIVQSGIYADDLTRYSQDQANILAQQQSQQASELANIRSRQAALPAQIAAEKAAAAAEAARVGLDLDLVKAAAKGGL